MPIFQDFDNQELIEGARVWIAGVEVTDRICSAVNVTQAGRGGSNSAEFSLSNANDGFVLTAANAAGTFQTAGNPGEYSEFIKKQLFDYKNDSKVNGEDPLTKERRWRLAPNSMLLHAFDPVFIAESWPYTQEELWIPRFKGFLEFKPMSEDWINGRSTIQASCVDLRSIMGRMRVQTNYLIANQLAVVTDSTTGQPGQEDLLNAIDPIIQTGIFADLQLATILTTPLAGLSLKDTIELMITGGITDTGEFDLPGYSNTARQDFLTRLNDAPSMSTKGVGKMRMGIAVAYPNKDGTHPNDVQLLEEWHRLTLFGVIGTEEPLAEDQIEDLGLTPGQAKLFAQNGRPWTTAEVEAHGASCTWDGPTAPQNMSLHLLLPSTEGGMVGITQFTVDTLSPERRWQSRNSIIEDYLEALDYHWTVTPVGDVVVEFPMYDFKPENFGEFADAFTVRHDGQGKSLDFDEDRPVVPTAMVVTAGYNPDIETLGQLAPANFPDGERSLLRVVMQAPILQARIGMNVEHYTMPFVLDDVCRLRQYAILRFQRALAEANEGGISMVYRPLLMPNRPILETSRDKMGWVAQVSTQMHPGRPVEYGAGATSVTIKYIRSLDPDGTYRLLTGSEFLPLSYTGKGVGIDAGRGVIVNDNISVLGGCGEAAVGAPPTVGDFNPNDPAEDCSTDADKLAIDVKELFTSLRIQASNRLQLDIELTCTHRDGTADPHEGFEPDLHIPELARAFDVSIFKTTGEPGTEADYERVGALGVSLGLTWGGTVPASTSSAAQERAKILQRAKFHSGRGTDYIFGGVYDPEHAMGVDCSGLVVDCYRFAGIMSKADTARTASQLEGRFNAVKKPSGGDMAFFGRGSATHVVLVDTDGKTLIGASGGNQSIQTIEQARKKGARVKIITTGISYRKDFRGFGSPIKAIETQAFTNHFSKT